MSTKRNMSASDCILGQSQIHQHNKVIIAVVINETMLNIILYFMLVLLSCRYLLQKEVLSAFRGRQDRNPS